MQAAGCRARRRALNGLLGNCMKTRNCIVNTPKSAKKNDLKKCICECEQASKAVGLFSAPEGGHDAAHNTSKGNGLSKN